MAMGESLYDHVGLNFKTAPESREVKMLNLRGEGGYQLSLIGRRLVSLNGEWVEVTEQKIVDERGKSSKVMVDQSFKTLSSNLSNEHVLYASPRLKGAVSSRSSLFRAKGRLTAQAENIVSAQLREAVKPCIQGTRHWRDNAPLWIHTDANGAIDAIGFEGITLWSDAQRCAAKLMSLSGVKILTDRPTLLRGIRLSSQSPLR